MSMTGPARSERTILLLAYVLPVVLGLTVLLGAWTTLGHRHQAQPLPVSFDVVVAASDGLRFYGVRAARSTATRGGWHQCGPGRYEHAVRRDGSRVEVYLVFHPDPQLGDCWSGHDQDDEDAQGAQGDRDPRSGIDPGLLVPLEGPAPAVVTVRGVTDDHEVVDPAGGPAVTRAGWQSTPPPFPYARPGVTVRQWEGTDGRSVRLSFPATHVGDARGASVRSGDLGPAQGSFADPPRVAPDLELRLGGVPVTAQFRAWDAAEAAYVRILGQDRRSVIELESDGVTLDDLRDLVLSLRA